MENGRNKGIFGGLLGEPTAEKGAGAAFSLAAILSPVVSFVFLAALSAFGVDYTPEDDWYLYCAYLIPQLCFLAAAIFFFKWTKTPIKAECHRQVRSHPLYYLFAIVLQTGLLSLSELNGWFLKLLGGLGFTDAGISLPSMDGFGFAGVVIAVALLPAVFEELFFRGVLLKGLETFGKTGAILFCGLLFSLYHQNPAQTVYQFICGAAFAWVALNARSILPTVVAHFLNNAFILSAEKFGFYARIEKGLLIVSIACLVLSVAGLVAGEILRSRRRAVRSQEGSEDGKQEKKGETAVAERKKSRRSFWICAAVGVLLCALSWALAFVSGLG